MMRSLELDLTRYDTDKIANGFLARYDPVLEPLVGKEISILELGVYSGGSLLLWHDYFPLATIAGIDIRLPRDFDPPDRVQVFEGDQSDKVFLSSVADQVAPGGFDLIIDDAGHMGRSTKISFWHLFEHHLKADGLYVIEDWGTGYWDDWPDGKSLRLESYDPQPSNSFVPATARRVKNKVYRELGIKRAWPSHSYGMVGLVKQLVDEQAAADVTRRTLGGTPTRNSKFDSILLVERLAFIRKASA
jgi:hypothetical protein